MFPWWVQILAGWFVADLGTGCVHLFFDNAKFARNWPVLGVLVRDFTLHHHKPQWFLRYGFFYSNREPLVVGALLMLLGLFIAPWFWITCGLGVALSQEAHRWAHRDEKPWIIRWLQTSHIIMPPASHECHHSQFGRSFGILNGWSHKPMNLVLWLCHHPVGGR